MPDGSHKRVTPQTGTNFGFVFDMEEPPVAEINSQSLNSKLQETLAKVKPGLRAYQDRLDRLSADIRTTENELKSANFNISLRVLARSWTQLGDDAVDDVEMGIQGTEWHYDEYLSWADVDGKGFRLYYELNEQEGYVETDGNILLARGKKGQPQLKERKPLIDCKAAKRLEMEPHLVKFLEEVGAKVDPDLEREAEEQKAESNRLALEAMTELWNPKARKDVNKAGVEKAKAGLKIVRPHSGGEND